MSVKARSNLSKHGVSFEVAQTAFLDEHARLIDDPDHSAVPGHQPCYRDAQSAIRLISARPATPQEEKYDFTRSRKDPYVKGLKRQITIRLDAASVEYFKQMAADLGMPYQNLIKLFLRDCAIKKRRPTIEWLGEAARK